MSPNSNSLLLVLVHLCLVCAASFASGNEFRNDYRYSPEAGAWFKLHRVPLDWHTAMTQCYHEGAVLASPVTGAVWSVLQRLQKTQAEGKAGVQRLHSGVHATFNHGVYSSVEGIPLEQLSVDWLPKQPNSLNNNQHCVAYNSSGMEQSSCEKLLPYICYRKLSVSDVLTECGTVDKSYKLDTRTGHCYKFHARAEVWWRALRVCHAEGGHLAVIDNALEAQVLRELFANHPRLLYTHYQNSAAIGFKEWGYFKSWWTIHGMQLEDTEYGEWSQGQPDNASGPGGSASRQACGAIFRTGKLDDVWCDEPLAFICEKTKYSLLNDAADEIF